MADELVPIVFDEIEKIATEGPEAKDINDSREYLVKQFKNTLENNGTWFGLIDDYNRHKQNLLADYEKDPEQHHLRRDPRPGEEAPRQRQRNTGHHASRSSTRNR